MDVEDNQQQTVTSWHSLFCTNLSAFEGSRIFMKQITALTFSCITHLRRIFPDRAYEVKYFEDKPVKILKGARDCENANTIKRWLKSAFDALDRKYMKELSFEVLSMDENIIEYYSMQFSYPSDESTISISVSQSMNNMDEELTKISTKNLINELPALFKNWGELPPIHKLRLRILYYDESMPSTYTPQNFTDEDFSGHNLSIPYQKQQSVEKVSTTFHCVALKVGSVTKPKEPTQYFSQDIFMSSNELSPKPKREEPVNIEDSSIHNSKEIQLIRSQSNLVDSGFNKFETLKRKLFSDGLAEEKNRKKVFTSESRLKQKDKDTDDNSATTKLETSKDWAESLKKNMTFSDTDSINESVGSKDSRTNEKEEEEEGPPTMLLLESQINSPLLGQQQKVAVKCICTLSFIKENLFKCDSCGNWSHLICYSLKAPMQNIEHFCYECSLTNEGNNFLDISLSSQTPCEAKETAIYRQVLFCIRNHSNVSVGLIKKELNIEAEVAERVMEKLADQRLIILEKNELYKVQENRLRFFIELFFNS